MWRKSDEAACSRSCDTFLVTADPCFSKVSEIDFDFYYTHWFFKHSHDGGFVIWPVGLRVWFALSVREVQGSNPGLAQALLLYALLFMKSHQCGLIIKIKKNNTANSLYFLKEHNELINLSKWSSPGFSHSRETAVQHTCAAPSTIHYKM